MQLKPGSYKKPFIGRTIILAKGTIIEAINTRNKEKGIKSLINQDNIKGQ